MARMISIVERSGMVIIRGGWKKNVVDIKAEPPTHWRKITGQIATFV